MAADAWKPSFGPASNTDVDVVPVLFPEAPESRGAAMAQSGVGSTGEHGSHPASLTLEMRASHRVHARDDRVEAPLPYTVFNRFGAEPEIKEVLTREYSVLRAG
jgi:hypothetical protein